MTDAPMRQIGEQTSSRGAAPSAPRPIKPLAFIAALILAPILCALPFLLTLLTIDKTGFASGGAVFLLVIPVLAVPFGGLQYLVFGSVAFWMALGRDQGTAIFGLIANLASLPFVAAYSTAFSVSGEVMALPMMCLAFGSVFAPVWGSVFGMLYRRFARGPRNVQN